jgi:hypothetical protein
MSLDARCAPEEARASILQFLSCARSARVVTAGCPRPRRFCTSLLASRTGRSSQSRRRPEWCVIGGPPCAPDAGIALHCMAPRRSTTPALHDLARQSPMASIVLPAVPWQTRSEARVAQSRVDSEVQRQDGSLSTVCCPRVGNA